MAILHEIRSIYRHKPFRACNDTRWATLKKAVTCKGVNTILEQLFTSKKDTFHWRIARYPV